MKSFLKFIFKVLLGILIVLLLFGVGVIGVRQYNIKKYNSYAENDNKEFSEPTNLSHYDVNLEGVEVERIEGNYLNGFHLKPDFKKFKGVVITFGGSEGSPNYTVAKDLAMSGYEVLSLFYFGMENQQKELVRVPLDFFEEVLDYIGENIEDGEEITLIGVSKGAELSLNLVVRYSEIDNVILISPGEYSYPGLIYSSNETETTSEIQSSWTYKGEEVPFISFESGDIKTGLRMFYDMITYSPLSFRGAYESSANKADNQEEARIKVENTDANILLIAGTDDLMWQSEVAAENIYNKRPEKTEKLIYQGAGHIFSIDRYVHADGMVLAMGGNKEINAEAQRDSNLKILSKLEEWHKK